MEISKEKLQEILDNHKKWLNNESGTERANLREANLREANLCGANLCGANLHEAETNKRYLSVSCIGSRKGITTYCFEDDIIWCGCFKGTLIEFEIKVNETHKNNEQYLKEYQGLIKYIRSLK